MGLWPVVGVVAMLEHQFAVEIDVELAVPIRHQAEAAYVIAKLLEDFARYPSGPGSVLSKMAILYGDVQLVLGHIPPPCCI